MARPKISIVTSSYNQGVFIERTIESIRAQDYPNVEHIVVDGMSKDDTPDILARYPHLKVIREPDRGQADAINKGFRIATGEIFGFVNSDDTLEPGALTAVAEAIDAAAGRRIVMGRCRFIDEDDRFLGVEHPSAFESHRRVLEIWRGHCLPQPSTFWTRDVWETAGPLNVEEQLMLDYDLFCRFSRQYPFHTIDRVLSNYRLHSQAKTSSVTDAERLEQAITVSRRYWGHPLSPRAWPVYLSYLRFRLNRRGRAVRLMRDGRAEFRQGRRLTAAAHVGAGALLAPDVVADVVVMPAVRPMLGRAVRRASTARHGVSPQTQAYLSGTALHADGWAGPTAVLTRERAPGQTNLVMTATMPPGPLAKPLEIEAIVNGQSLGRKPVTGAPDFYVVWPVPEGPTGPCQVKLVANGFVVPHDQLGTQDYRPLSYHLISLDFAVPR